MIELQLNTHQYHVLTKGKGELCFPISSEQRDRLGVDSKAYAYYGSKTQCVEMLGCIYLHGRWHVWIQSAQYMNYLNL